MGEGGLPPSSLGSQNMIASVSPDMLGIWNHLESVKWIGKETIEW